jgi:ribosome-associated protein
LPDPARSGRRKLKLARTPNAGSGQKRASKKATARRELAATDAIKVVLNGLEEAKAEDLVSIDITGKSALGDFIVVASGRSQRHVGAIADRLVDDLKSAGGRNLRIEGMPHCDWVLIDAGDVIVHIFHPEVRTFYNIEKMWLADNSAGPVAV